MEDVGHYVGVHIECEGEGKVLSWGSLPQVLCVPGTGDSVLEQREPGIKLKRADQREWGPHCLGSRRSL